MGMDLDFGIELDTSAPLGTNFPSVAQRSPRLPGMENAELGREPLGEVRRPGMSGDRFEDGDVEVARAWGAVANIALQRGILVRRAPETPPPDGDHRMGGM